MKKLWHVRTGSTHSAVRKDEILPFATTWVNLKNIMVSEISQTGKEPYDFTHMWDIKLKATNEQTRKTKNKQKSETQTTVWWLPEEKESGGKNKGK